MQFEQIFVTQEQIYKMRSFWDEWEVPMGIYIRWCFDATKEVIMNTMLPLAIAERIFIVT